MTDVAWIADGALYRRTPDGLVREVNSPFVERVRDQATRIAERYAWKRQGESPDALMQRARAAEAPAPVRFTAVCGGDRLRYTIDTGAVGGLFAIDDDGSELRLFHTERFRLRALAPGRDGELLTCVTSGARVHLATLRADGSGLRELTEGDAIDLNPRLSPDGRRVVYQSAGLARDAQYAGAIGHFEILSLDLRDGSITTEASEPDRDLLLPRIGPDGALWYLRTPPRPQQPGALARAAGLVMWPLHVLAGLFNLVGLLGRWSNLPGSATAGGPTADDARLRQLLLHGALTAPSTVEQPPPPSASDAWELVRRRPGQAPEVVARRVVAWDLGPDGSVLLTDGHAVTAQRADGTREQLATGVNVHAVAWIRPPGPAGFAPQAT